MGEQNVDKRKGGAVLTLIVLAAGLLVGMCACFLVVEQEEATERQIAQSHAEIASRLDKIEGEIVMLCPKPTDKPAAIAPAPVKRAAKRHPDCLTVEK